MKKSIAKSFVYSSFGLMLTVCFALPAFGQGPADTNRLQTGGNYQIAPPPSNMMFQVTANPTNAGDDNLIWSNSGRILAVDRSDPTVTNGSNKYISLLDVRDLGNIQVIGARSSAVSNGLFPNITSWTWNDDRVLFGWQPQLAGNPPQQGKCRLMSCASGDGPIDVQSFLMSDPQDNPTNHIYSPSVIYDQAAGKERLLCLVSSADNNPTGPGPGQRVNLYTVTYASGGVPNWNERVQLTAFNTNLSIQSAKWCPELGTNYQPICDRLVILITEAGGGGPVDPPPTPVENNKIATLTGVRDIIAGATPLPTSLADPRIIILETNLTMNSQVSWTFDGQYVMFGRMTNMPPPSGPATDLYSIRADSATNTAVKFETPASISGGQKQWLCISPDGMKAAFTVDKQVYVIPLQFDNIAVTGAVVTNVLTDASYTAVDVAGAAINSNTTFQIVAPPSVDTNNFNGEFSGFAREFSVSGVSSQFNLNTNAEMTLHFSQSDIPEGASATNLAVYVYNPQGTNAGQTGTWDKLNTVINTNLLTVTCTAEHFSVYAIGRASAQPEGTIPIAPTGISATKGSHQEKVLVTWTAAANATSYQVWRNTVNDSGTATRFTAAPTSASYNDTNATPGTLYYYWIKAQNIVGASSFSSSDSGYAMGVHNAYAADLDGDRKADPTVYYEGVTTWTVKLSGSGYSPALNLLNFLGGPGYVGLSADFDGDRLADPAAYKAATGTWLVKLSSGGYTLLTLTGFLGDSAKTAVAADLDGDAKADPTVYEAATGTWIVKLSSGGYAPLTLTGFLGSSGWSALAADFDGDGKADPTIYQAATGLWTIKLSSGQYAPIAISLGGSGWQALAGDIDGDGLADPAVFQPTTGNWIIELSGSGYAQLPLTGFLGGL